MLTVPIQSTISTSTMQKEMPVQKQLTWQEEYKFRQALGQAMQSSENHPEAALSVGDINILKQHESACADYALAQARFLFHQENKKNQQQQIQLEQEAELILNMGSKAVSMRLLTEYLKVQLAHYKKHLESVGLSKPEVSEKLKQLRTETIKRCILQALSDGNYVLAQEILTQESPLFEDNFIQECVVKIRRQFAYEQAHELWKTAYLQYPDDVEKAGNWACQQIQESDPNLRMLIETSLNKFQQEAQILRAKQQADLFRTWARNSTEEMISDCAQQTMFTPEQLVFLYEVCLRLALPAKTPNPALFVKFYFSSTEKENKEAFLRGDISARDYLLLEAARLEREVGEDDKLLLLRCRQLKNELSKKRFADDEIYRIQYEFLSSADFTAAWNTFQHLLNQ